MNERYCGSCHMFDCTCVPKNRKWHGYHKGYGNYDSSNRVYRKNAKEAAESIFYSISSSDVSFSDKTIVIISDTKSRSEWLVCMTMDGPIATRVRKHKKVT